jgi:hypothetical protein
VGVIRERKKSNEKFEKFEQKRVSKTRGEEREILRFLIIASIIF